MASNRQEDSHDTNDANEAQNVENEIRRGITIMKAIIRARDKGIKYDVHWSDENQLIEPNGAMLTSYIGSLARQHIPITSDNWRNKLLEAGKEKIWTEIQVCTKYDWCY